MTTRVSIITTTYTTERLRDIQQLIDSIAAQSSADFEALVVAERSRILQEQLLNYIAEKQYERIRVIFNPGPYGISTARNLAVKQAQGEYLAFVDDDAVLDIRWVQKIIDSYQDDPTVVGVTGPISPWWEKQSLAWFPPELYWILSCTSDDPRTITEVRNGYGTNLSFERQAVIQCGFFNPDLGVKGHGRKGWQEPGAEETDLSMRIRRATGKRIIFNPDVRVRHRVYTFRVSPRFITKRAFWEGYAKSLLKSRLISSPRYSGTLSTEYTLLRRIFTRTIPDDLKLLVKKPWTAIRQLAVIAWVLPCVAVGYLTRSLLGRKK